MKNIFKTLIIFYFITSCVDDGKCTDITNTLVNNSGKDVVITSYKNHYPNVVFGTISKTISVTNNSRISKSEKSCPPDNYKVKFNDLVEGDSIIIDYGDKIKRYGNRINTDRNPYGLENTGDNKVDYFYILTPEDYTNAIPK